MKSYINKFLAGAAILAMAGLTACTGDLDQLPNDPATVTPNKFPQNPKEYVGEVMAKCYSSLAVSGQSGPNGDADIKGLDGGTSQWSRTVFMCEEFPTDECLWMYDDGGVDEMRWGTWGSANVVIFGTYSRLYTHIAVCNDFLRLVNDPDKYGVTFDEATQKEVDQFKLEARALRGLSYYYVINFFGNAALAWDDVIYGTTPQQTTRTELFNKVTADLEEVLAAWPDNLNKGSVVYGRIGKDAVEGLLCKYYLNAEVFTGTAQYGKCLEHAQNIINRHKGGGFQGSGLAKDYLALFCDNNAMFAPGGALAAQNEILWGIPQNSKYTQPYGGATFLVNGAIKNMAAAESEIMLGDKKVEDGYMNQTYYGTNDSWGCMHARPQLSDKFNFVNGKSQDGRAYLWLTEGQGFSKDNIPFNKFEAGYACIKFTAVEANADGTIDKFVDPVTGINRVGRTRQEQNSVIKDDGTVINWTSYITEGDVSKFHNTTVPLIRLADVYLMAAEAAMRGAGSQADALTYVNYVRERAGVPAWNSGELTLRTLLDERSRELYWEMTRRTDLVRYGLFTGSGYLWQWKGGVESGTSLRGDHFNIYPIPSDVIATYGSAYKQNPGY